MKKEKVLIDSFLLDEKPNYVSHADEETVFRLSFEKKIPVILKGPTGCGKTRFVEYMSYELGVPLLTVACHEDLTAADLIGQGLKAKAAIGRGQSTGNGVVRSICQLAGLAGQKNINCFFKAAL